jgi:hypothetical protein
MLLSNPEDISFRIYRPRPVILLPDGIYFFRVGRFLDDRGVISSKIIDFSTKEERLEDYIEYRGQAIQNIELKIKK